ncbi:DNA-3-methyladenine glycosylase family protein [Nocardioides cynanchi]|uniref:DNA-3-methyladenine glycosylase family protein n=1 Tax=Nocardioides cynanchi TaxID=2558918 RepID=UPI001247B0A8|nr:DNA-3-methyladenine glycosylase 2 family protein [Nocardioides cynanchi]
MTTTATLAPATTIDWPVRGRFDLAQSIGFGFGGRPAARGSAMRLAFVVDGYDAHAGVGVTQLAPDVVRFEVVGGADPERVAAQAARVLSLDEDATGYDRMVDADPVLREAYARRPGLRPPLFSSAYEALVWAVLSARRPAARMAVVRERLARAHGQVLEVAGESVAAVPTPDQLLAVSDFPGIPEVALRRMHAIAAAARAGELDTEALRMGEVGEVGDRLRGFAGIGPFYSELVTVRALGHTDVLPTCEPRVLAATAARVGSPSLGLDDFAAIAEAWRPWRTWACVALRAAAS